MHTVMHLYGVLTDILCEIQDKCIISVLGKFVVVTHDTYILYHNHQALLRMDKHVSKADRLRRVEEVLVEVTLGSSIS